MRILTLAAVLLFLPLQAIEAQPLGMKVTRFQLVANALKHPGLYRAAVDYMDEVSFPKYEVLTCYWKVSPESGDILITNVLPDATRTIQFTKAGDDSWTVSEI